MRQLFAPARPLPPYGSLIRNVTPLETPLTRYLRQQRLERGPMVIGHQRFCACGMPVPDKDFRCSEGCENASV